MARFDELFEQGAALVAAGTHLRDAPPTDGGRWPVAVILRPPVDHPVGNELDHLTVEAVAFAGPGHWQTGRLGSAHLTVRALEPYRAAVDPTEPLIQRYCAALRAAAETTGPLTFEVAGLTLTPGTVMACAHPADPNADAFLDRFTEALGPDAWYELPDGRRDIWYLNLLHFTTGIPDPELLITWVKAHRRTPYGTVTIRAAELVRFHLHPTDRPHMRPTPLASAPFNARPSPR